MAAFKNIDGHYYPAPHDGWGGFAEELFHYSSRYYCATEAFLRNLAGNERFRLSGYKAANLSPQQRDLMAAVLSRRPDADTAAAVIAIVEAVLRGEDGVDAELLTRFAPPPAPAGSVDTASPQVQTGVPLTGEVDPLDPFLNMAERLLMPVAVRGRRVEVPMLELARHLDSTNARVRSNLQDAVIALHHAGYVLHNHPHLTHSEAHLIGDPGSV